MQLNKTVIQGDKVTFYGDKWLAFNDDSFMKRAFFSIKSISMFEYDTIQNILWFRVKYDSQLYFKEITPTDYDMFLHAMKILGE